MNNFKNIQNKLEQFIKKYYVNELIKGSILFFTIGLLYFLLTLFIEFVLWLNPIARTVLFWLFIVVEGALLFKFIAIPLAKLLKLQKGINYEDASIIIGRYFPEVNDKLLNVLQLHQDPSKSELLLASINQKSEELKPIPFRLAINFKRNAKYLKYIAIPISILVLTFFTGNFDWFSDSYQRIVHYKTAYQPPAPFQFFVINEDLSAVEDKDFKLQIRTVGDVVPENAEIRYNNETYLLKQTGVGEFEYVFSQPKSNIDFELFANDIMSKPYTLKVLEVPSILSFEMILDYPKYTQKKSDVLKSTGNAVVPEGTNITWRLKTKSTDNVHFYATDTIPFISDKADGFELSKCVFYDFNYHLSTSNTYLNDYENLGFNIDVVKDEYPEIKLKMIKDSLDLQSLYFNGQISDDYGFTKLELVYYPSDDENTLNYVNIPFSTSNISDFITAFPNNLNIKTGVSYEVYFQVVDNDAVNSYKKTKSNVFSFRKRTLEEEKEKQLNEQSETIQDLNKGLEKFEDQNKELNELSKNQKQKASLNFNDQKKLESFLKRQRQQDEMMKNFNEKLKDNLENFQNETNDIFKEDLKKRLEDNEEQLKKDEKLLDELEELHDKINNEELSKKLDELSKENKNKERSLEQLLELTKRFYVGKKTEQLQQDLEKLSNEQDTLSEAPEDKNTKEGQEVLNQKFENFKKELNQLQKDNKALKKPLDIFQDKLTENEIQKEQQEASDQLERKEEDEDQDTQEENLKSAKRSQKNAAQKMKDLSQKMQQSSQAGGGEQMQEDSEMLRQILDNLLVFSFDQEELMNHFNGIEINHNKYASFLRKQGDLRAHFSHIDDSLFALSLRQPKLSENINKEITEVYFNIDKALDLLAENQLYQGVSNQQFAITAANNLADFLSDIMDNMEEQLNPSNGKGKGDMQLPDIIMSQEQLNKMMEKGLEKLGNEGEPKEGKGEPKEGEGQQSGQEGKNGKQGEGENGALYEIYKEQQRLRQALQERMSKEGQGASSSDLLNKMEDVEMDLLNKGFTNETLKKMLALKHQLLKLESAAFQQGQDSKREAETNSNDYFNRSVNQIPTAKQYFKTTEILNRQTLPLRQVYKKRVRTYFKQEDDQF